MGDTSKGKRPYRNLRGSTIIFMSDGTTQAANTARSLNPGKNYLILDINVFIFMCICLYVSNINFFYSNLLSFVSVPVSHHSGVGWLCTSVAFEVAQSNIIPGKKLSAKGPVLTLLLPLMERLDQAGVTLSPHVLASQCWKVLGQMFLNGEELAPCAGGTRCPGACQEQ